MKLSSFLKHTFLPHEGNNYRPHFFREHVLLTTITLSIFLLIVSFTTYTLLRTTAFGSSVASSVLIDLTNETRIKNNLPPLANNLQLKQAAILKGMDMNARQYFSHYSPEGTSPWHWIEEAGYRYLYAGENLAINFKNSKDVEEAWLASRKHKENILSDRYKDIGIGVVRGKADGRPVLFIVQMFGTPSQESTSKGYEASWYELLLFNAPSYIATFYTVLVVIIMIALIIMISIEAHKQHVKHILYAILLLFAVAICLVINSTLA